MILENTAEKRLAQTFFLVEADSFAKSQLWLMYSNKSPKNDPNHNVEWEQVMDGFGVQVGEFSRRPVNISIFWAKINGQLVAFWHASSQVVDYKMCGEWLAKYFSRKWDNNTRDSTCDAQNFYQCIEAIREENE